MSFLINVAHSTLVSLSKDQLQLLHILFHKQLKITIKIIELQK